ncbi:MAG TPA: hypothetical protein VGC41_27350, partial [Kofleriaceae bacterium]
MRTLALVVIVAGCGSSKPAPAPAPLPPTEGSATAPAPPAAPTVERYEVVIEDRKAGFFQITDTHDGAFAVAFDIVENGRGPHADGTFRIGPEGYVQSFHATGHHTMGTPSKESFSIEGTHGQWKSDQEHGEADSKEPAFFNWMAEFPADPWFVPLALRNHGKVKMWPVGEATVEKIADAVAGTKHVDLYRISGLSYEPYYAWFEGMHFFGYTEPGYSLLRE